MGTCFMGLQFHLANLRLNYILKTNSLGQILLCSRLQIILIMQWHIEYYLVASYYLHWWKGPCFNGTVKTICWNYVWWAEECLCSVNQFKVLHCIRGLHPLNVHVYVFPLDFEVKSLEFSCRCNVNHWKYLKIKVTSTLFSCQMWQVIFSTRVQGQLVLHIHIFTH